MKRQTQTDKLIIGTVVGASVIIGLIASVTARYYRTFHGDVVLKNVKKLFAIDKQIEGSWIELKPVKKEFDGKLLKVYYGGITCKEGEQMVQYEFVANAKSGVLLDLYPLPIV